MNIEIKWNDGLHFEGKSPSGHLVHMDSTGAGLPSKGPSPVEMLVQAAAVCTAMDIVFILEKRRKTLQAFRVAVEAERADSHPKKLVKLHLTYDIKGRDIAKDEAERAVQLSVEKYCSVLSSLDPNVDLSWDIQLTA